MEIYQPDEDSYMLAEALKGESSNYSRNIKILDMGSGSGIQAETCLNLGFKNIICADINENSVLLLQKKGFNAVRTNLFSSFDKKEKFDLIIFNPPYLPEHKHDKEKDTTGGKQGHETIVEFLKQAKSYLSKTGRIFIVYSSLSKPNIIKREIKKLGYKFKIVNQKKFFFENIYVVRLSFNKIQ